MALLIFTAEIDAEELQIANLDEEASLSHHYVNDAKIKVKLERREDTNKQIYYLAKLRDNFIIEPETDGGISFVIFTSKEGKEEIQIGGKITSLQPASVEVVKRRPLT